VFIDPDPDPEASWTERMRLFELPQSSWADYDPTLLASSSGVWPRTAKRSAPAAAAAWRTRRSSRSSPARGRLA